MTGPVRVAPLPVRTERLLLRAARAEDHDDLLAYYGDASITAYVPFEAFDADTFAPRLQRYVDSTDPQLPGDALNAMIDLDGRVVGDIMLRLTASPSGTESRPSMAEIGWVLHPSYGGRGLATEAARAVLALGFDHYDLHRVHAQLDPRNTPSARICERLGMTHEGITRRDYFSRGEWSDTSVWGILREEWRGGIPG